MKEKTMVYPRLVIAGVHSGVGKTTIALGVMAALSKRGLKVRPYKVGPDYIDPGLHYHATGVKSHNLDSWMGRQEVLKSIFLKNSRAGDISVIEGAMGLFDGARNERLRGSTAHVALILDSPVVLVVDVKGLGRSCLPLIQGFKEFEPALNLSGVILNKAGGDFYGKTIKNSIEEELGIRVFGCLPNNRDITIPERRLGLLPAEENKELKNVLVAMADMIETQVDLDGMIEIAGLSGEGNLVADSVRGNNGFTGGTGNRKVTIGVAKDRAFGFYYQDNLDYLQELGATLKFFSPLNDGGIGGVDGLYIGGGFPEKYLDELAGNASMIASIKDAHTRGLPIFAEGEGFVYLAKKITDLGGASHPCVGLVPACVRMTKKLSALGYVTATVISDSVIADKGDTLKGHEFHYADVEGLEQEDRAFRLTGGKGADNRLEGFVRGNLTATYSHYHFRSNPKAAVNFIKACLNYKKRRGGFKRLRSGFTTGACAAAATRAALQAVINKKHCKTVTINLPQGGTIRIPIKNIVVSEDVATAEVVKDAGDDLDVTNGMSVFARVEPHKDGAIV
ncbi:MAG TPA: cobyrinate a,c-diamide synthase, partial [Clostridia bacterium]|nr:cobyrinate a,c-diamide synthase [Clostridia bacterium]